MNAPRVAASAAGSGRGVQPCSGDLILVDDTPADLHMICSMLRELGYKVRPVCSAPPALALAKAAPPDLILTGIYLPGMHGYEFCQRLKGDAVLKNVPVIFLSVLHTAMDKVMAFRAGGAAYIQKPCHSEELHAIIQTHLDNRRLQREVLDLSGRLENLAQATVELCATDNLRSDCLALISQELSKPETGLLCQAEAIMCSCREAPDLSACQAAFEQSRRQVMALLEYALQGRLPDHGWPLD